MSGFPFLVKCAHVLNKFPIECDSSQCKPKSKEKPIYADASASIGQRILKNEDN